MDRTDETRGARVFWPTLDAKGNPKSWGCVHRVFQGGLTYCSRAVPDTAQKPGNKQGRPCSRCERMYQQASRYLQQAASKASA